MKMRMRNTCIQCSVVLMFHYVSSARAADAVPEVATPVASPPPEGVPPPRDELFRASLGIAFWPLWVTNQGAAGVGTLGGLTPFPEIGFELRVAAPLWLVARGWVAYAESEAQGEMSNLGGGGDLGVRLEWPIVRWLDAGGHAFVGATGSSWENEPDVGAGTSGWSAGVRASTGVGAHFRFGDLVGLRLSCDLVRVRHDRGEAPGGQTFASTSVDGGPAPRAELTFSF